jgi:hypothetical protein
MSAMLRLDSVTDVASIVLHAGRRSDAEADVAEVGASLEMDHTELIGGNVMSRMENELLEHEFELVVAESSWNKRHRR